MLADAPQFARAHQCLAIVSSQAVFACVGRAAVGRACSRVRRSSVGGQRRERFLSRHVLDWASPSIGVPPVWRLVLLPLAGSWGLARPVAKGFARQAAGSELSLTLGIRLSN